MITSILDKYEYNGFKLFIENNENNEIIFEIIIQYKNGIPFKCWIKLEGSDEWIKGSVNSLPLQIEFVKNLTEEEVFETFL